MSTVVFDKTKGSSHCTVKTDQGDTVRAENVVVVGGKVGNVESVNGQTGVVVLDAANVGAVSADQGQANAGKVLGISASGAVTPVTVQSSVSSVNGQTGAVSLTATDVGAVPANAGTANAGKVLGINESGAVVPVDAASGGGSIQVTTLPVSAPNGTIVQYVGPTTSSLVNGLFYKFVDYGQPTISSTGSLTPTSAETFINFVNTHVSWDTTNRPDKKLHTDDQVEIYFSQDFEDETKYSYGDGSIYDANRKRVGNITVLTGPYTIEEIEAMGFTASAGAYMLDCDATIQSVGGTAWDEMVVSKLPDDTLVNVASDLVEAIQIGGAPKSGRFVSINPEGLSGNPGTFSTQIGATNTQATSTYSIAVGAASHSTSQYAISIGGLSYAKGAFSIALGGNAKAQETDAIQIGGGTNTEANTLYVGFWADSEASRRNYKLLDGTTGLIPAERLTGIIRQLTTFPEVPQQNEIFQYVGDTTTDAISGYLYKYSLIGMEPASVSKVSGPTTLNVIDAQAFVDGLTTALASRGIVPKTGDQVQIYTSGNRAQVYYKQLGATSFSYMGWYDCTTWGLDNLDSGGDGKCVFRIDNDGKGTWKWVQTNVQPADPDVPEEEGSYTLKATRAADGTVTKTWVKYE